MKQQRDVITASGTAIPKVAGQGKIICTELQKDKGMTEKQKDIGRMSINNCMATTPFGSHLFPHAEGTLLLYGTSLAQQMAKNLKNESIYFNCSSIHFPLSSVQISAIAIQRSG